MEALPQGIDAQSDWSHALAQFKSGYVAQPEMRQLIERAEELGWTLLPYETRSHPTEGNDREADQARNLVDALATLPPDAPLFVWCGWGHLCKEQLSDTEWRPMAAQFWEASGVEPFSIDQTVTVETVQRPTGPWHQLARIQTGRLAALGGTAGFLVEDSPIPRVGVDAVLLSIENTLE
jgi:hypothetical protein